MKCKECDSAPIKYHRCEICGKRMFPDFGNTTAKKGLFDFPWGKKE